MPTDYGQGLARQSENVEHDIQKSVYSQIKQIFDNQAIFGVLNSSKTSLGVLCACKIRGSWKRKWTAFACS